MDQRERVGDYTEAFQAALDGRQMKTWTIMPGIIQSFDATKMTCEVQVALQGKQTKSDGTQEDITLPVLVDCPISYPRGGGFTLTFTPVKDDECLVFFASRCIDAWWQQGGVQPQQEFRMHDLSDGFVFVGISSKPNVIKNIKANAAQLRSDDGKCYLEVAAQDITAVGPINIDLESPVVDTSDNLNVGTGATGTFTTGTGQTVTVADGIVTNIF